MTDSNMAPAAVARERQRKLRVSGLHKSWLTKQGDSLAKYPAPLQAEIVGAAFEKAQQIAARADAVLSLSRDEWDQIARRFVSQTRRLRHGQLPGTESEWRAQMDAIRAEFGLTQKQEAA